MTFRRVAELRPVLWLGAIGLACMWWMNFADMAYDGGGLAGWLFLGSQTLGFGFQVAGGLLAGINGGSVLPGHGLWMVVVGALFYVGLDYAVLRIARRQRPGSANEPSTG